jgi:hypothetical protein
VLCHSGLKSGQCARATGRTPRSVRASASAGVAAGARHSWCIVASMRKLPLATVTLVCWSQRCLALLAAQPDLPSSFLFFCLLLFTASRRGTPDFFEKPSAGSRPSGPPNNTEGRSARGQARQYFSASAAANPTRTRSRRCIRVQVLAASRAPGPTVLGPACAALRLGCCSESDPDHRGALTYAY